MSKISKQSRLKSLMLDGSYNSKKSKNNNKRLSNPLTPNGQKKLSFSQKLKSIIEESEKESSFEESSDEEEFKISDETASDDRGKLLAASKTFEAPNQLLLLEGAKLQPKRKMSRKETLRNKSFEEDVEFAEPN